MGQVAKLNKLSSFCAWGLLTNFRHVLNKESEFKLGTDGGRSAQIISLSKSRDSTKQKHSSKSPTFKMALK